MYSINYYLDQINLRHVRNNILTDYNNQRKSTGLYIVFYNLTTTSSKYTELCFPFESLIGTANCYCSIAPAIINPNKTKYKTTRLKNRHPLKLDYAIWLLTLQ